MNKDTLQGKKVAILVAEGFEQVELTGPRQALHEAGAETRIVSPAKGQVQGWNHFDKGEKFTVDVALDQARPRNSTHCCCRAALPTRISCESCRRRSTSSVTSSRRANRSRPSVTRCGRSSMPTSFAGRTMTSWPSLRTDLINAGAKWVDQEVVVDNGLVSSRKPADIPAFNRKMIEEITEGKHQRQPAGAGRGRSGSTIAA